MIFNPIGLRLFIKNETNETPIRAFVSFLKSSSTCHLTLRPNKKSWYIQVMRLKYTDRYHDFEELFASLQFREWEEDLRGRYARFGAPLPEKKVKGIEHYGQHPWLDHMWKAVQESQQNPEIETAVNTLFEQYPWPVPEDLLEEYLQAESEIEDKYILHPLGEYIDQLIKDFFDYDKKEHKKEWQIAYSHIFNRVLKINKKYQEPFSVGWRRFSDDPDAPMELYVLIKPHMTKHDISDNWSYIAREKKKLPGYKAKFNEREFAGRDRLIWDLYCKNKEEGYTHKKASRNGRIAPTIYGKVSGDLEKYDFKNVTDSTVKKVVTKMRKRLGPE